MYIIYKTGIRGTELIVLDYCKMVKIDILTASVANILCDVRISKYNVLV